MACNHDKIIEIMPEKLILKNNDFKDPYSGNAFSSHK